MTPAQQPHIKSLLANERGGAFPALAFVLEAAERVARVRGPGGVGAVKARPYTSMEDKCAITADYNGLIRHSILPGGHISLKNYLQSLKNSTNKPIDANHPVYFLLF